VSEATLFKSDPAVLVDLGPQPSCWWTEYARRNCGVPEGWVVCIISSAKEDAPEGMCKLTGAVFKGGGWKKRDKTSERVLFVPRFAARDLRNEVAAEKGGCGNCWGRGQENYGWNRDKGEMFRTCPKCEGTGRSGGGRNG
jgi:hypothetical protein